MLVKMPTDSNRTHVIHKNVMRVYEASEAGHCGASEWSKWAQSKWSRALRSEWAEWANRRSEGPSGLFKIRLSMTGNLPWLISLFQSTYPVILPYFDKTRTLNESDSDLEKMKEETVETLQLAMNCNTTLRGDYKNFATCVLVKKSSSSQSLLVIKVVIKCVAK